jgi:hypothetical protein
MAQRASGYERRPNEEYSTPRAVTLSIVPYLRELGIRTLWEPAPAPDDGLANVLRAEGFTVISTTGNFLTAAPPADDIDCILTNPPYGEHKRGEVAEAFIRHAMTLTAIRHTILLLAIDFDSAKGRPALFRDNPAFTGKITLLGRIKWFPGPKSPSSNHSWFLWNREHVGWPVIRYALLAPHNQQQRRP